MWKIAGCLAVTTAIAAAQPSMTPPEEGQEAPPPGGPPPQALPPAGAATATFVSTGAMQWDVTLDNQLACTTPCSAPVLPLQFVALHSRELNPVRLDVGFLPGGNVVVRGKPLDNGLYAAGVTFTALTGTGLATGITLTAVGCSTDHSTMCTAGVITGIASAVGLYGSIVLMRHAAPRAYVSPAGAGIAGTF